MVIVLLSSWVVQYFEVATQQPNNQTTQQLFFFGFLCKRGN